VLELVSTGIVSLWLNLANVPDPLRTMGNAPWQDTPWLLVSGSGNPETAAVLQQYLKTLEAQGWNPSLQGIWLQSGMDLLGSNQGETPLPAASLTKVATSLAALETWGPDYQFETLVTATGPVINGVLQGDLVIHGSGDPLFVWEEAIALGNDLNQAGIHQISGDLIITGNFQMNFETEGQAAGMLLKQAFDSTQWSGEIEAQYQTLPTATRRPQVAIAGTVQRVPYGTELLPPSRPLVQHRSLPMAQMLKLMNLYSNNVIAESLATLMGGGAVVAQKAAQAAAVPPEEILLINGSGLGMENRISPRAACALFAALQRHLSAHNRTIGDIFPIAGMDGGSIEGRKIPTAAVVKTGTLNEVSALAGVVPTRRGLVWFAIMNRGSDVEGFRQQQDVFLQTLVHQWGNGSSPAAAIAPTPPVQGANPALGDRRRNQLVRSAVEFNTYGGS